MSEQPEYQSRFRVRHQMNVTFTENTRVQLDKLAKQYNILYVGDVPRDAELIRVLLVAALTTSNSLRERVACTLYCNSVLTLSGYFAEVVENLRTNIGKMAGRVANTTKYIEPERRAPRSVANANKRSSRRRVFLTIDDWMRYRLEERLGSTDADLLEKTAPDVKLVNRLLENALKNIPTHLPVIQAYSAAITNVRATIAKAVIEERDRLAKTLDSIYGA